MNHSYRPIFAGTCLAAILLISFAGCEGAKSTLEPEASPAVVVSAGQAAVPTAELSVEEPKEFEFDAKGLLAATLADSELSDGWINLFDGQSLFGWSIVGKANWRAEDGVLKVDRGEKSFLCTNLELADCELSVDFRADVKTNSGLFLRTQTSPEAGWQYQPVTKICSAILCANSDTIPTIRQLISHRHKVQAIFVLE